MRTIIMDEFLRLENPNVIDVREKDEYENGHIKGALLMPLNTLPNKIQFLDKTRTFHVVCHSGARSTIASQYLAQNGFKVVNVMGGMSAYKGELDYEV